MEHRRAFGLGFGFDVDRDLGVEPRAAGLPDAASLDSLDGALDRLAIADARPPHMDLQAKVASHPVLEHLKVQLTHARDQGLARLLVDPEGERGVLARE